MNHHTSFPDFTTNGYRVSKLLSPSAGDSVIVWQGETINNKPENNKPEPLKVVIKQFRFATDDSSWSKYQACQQEIQLLQSLDHPGIPKFINSFETDNSFCFVREYLPGKSLANYQDLTAKNIIEIALKSLEILVYLQQQKPPILHLNITPEHILVDQDFQVYLSGFSLMQNHSARVDPRSIKPDNALFAAPEQWQAPTLATDLYSLGATLEEVMLKQLSSRLISGRSSILQKTEAEQENSDPNPLSSVFELMNLATASTDLQDFEIDSDFQAWLATMTESDIFDRYADAATSLEDLKASFWDEITLTKQNEITEAINYRGLGLSILVLFVLGIAIALGIEVAHQVTEINFINMAIALMGMVVIYLTQTAATTIVTQEQTEQQQGIIIAVTIPLAITVITGFIFGRGEAVAMSLAVVFVEILSLVTTIFKPQYSLPGTKIWLGFAASFAIALGIMLGNGLSN